MTTTRAVRGEMHDTRADAAASAVVRCRGRDQRAEDAEWLRV
ncbi:hypothetical protein [Agromyces sp. Marseille-Q5079]